MKTKSPKAPPRQAMARNPPRHGAGMFSPEAWRAIGRRLKLSGRELEIVRGVFEDQTELAIAAGLNISPHTVHTHVERLHRKLRVGNRVQLVLRMMDEFLAVTASPAENLPPVCPAWTMGQCARLAAR